MSDNVKKEVERQLKIIKRGIEDLIPEDEFIAKLEKSIKNRIPLRVKQGFDPTAPDIHLGHTVGLRKLKQFQDLNHQIVLIIGDYTGMVGDPSEKKDTRPRLTHEEVVKNARTYEKQFFKILDRSRTEVRYNGEWFSKMSFAEIMELASKFTIARMLERDDFAYRYKHERPISIHEFFYPLMQGYDSVAVKADVEIGATEQKFNLLIARQIQKEYKQKPQVILTLPILEGIDGTQRMSKTTGNYIGIDESPDQMFGKTMSIPDELIYKYFVLLTDLKPSELDEIERLLGEKSVNPMVLKRRLARKLVSLYHSEEKALIAEKDFDRVFRYKKVPLKIREFSPSLKNNKIWIVKLLCLSGLASSNSEAKRLIKQGGVRIDGEQVVDENLELEKGSEFILNVGKRRFVKIIL